MTTALFPDLPESPSPKLQWLNKHGLDTHCCPEFACCPESPETGDTCYPWACYKDSRLPSYTERFLPGVGVSEDDCIWDYCRKNDLTHYSLE